MYYIVYDKDMKELGRFIEIEVNKDKVDPLNATKRGAEGTLNYYADKLKELGLTPQNRMKKSLFEMYVKDKS